MSFVLKIFLKVLLYSIIVIVVKSIIGKIQEPSAGLNKQNWVNDLLIGKFFKHLYDCRDWFYLYSYFCIKYDIKL